MKKNKILMVCSELAPYANVGDLGEVVKSLSSSLDERGHDVRIIIPLYKKILSENIFALQNISSISTITTGNNSQFPVAFWQTRLEKNITLYFLQNDFYFTARHKIYGYVDDAYRFVFFNLAVVKFLLSLDWIPDIILTYDWHTALISSYLKFYDKKLNSIPNIFTIHDIKYQGKTDPDVLTFADLPEDLFHPDSLEFFGKLNLMKSGIIYSDLIITTSELYATEIQTVECGAGLGGLLQAKNNWIKGVVHGIDYNKYDPQTDDNIAANYSTSNIIGKIECKKTLQKELNLPVHSEIPIMVIPGRLIDKTAYSMLLFLAEYLKRLEVQIIILESRFSEFEEAIKKIPIRSNCLITNVDTNWRDNPKLWAGADMLLLPVRANSFHKELLLALRYGVIPIVYGVNDLDKDFMDNFDKTAKGKAFVFSPYNSKSLFKTFRYAFDTYNKVALWTMLIKNALSVDVSWENTVNKYIKIMGMFHDKSHYEEYSDDVISKI